MDSRALLTSVRALFFVVETHCRASDRSMELKRQGQFEHLTGFAEPKREHF